MTRTDIAEALKKAGLEVPDEELEAIAEGVEILERLAVRLAARSERTDEDTAGS